jgi:hypothetical protein
MQQNSPFFMNYAFRTLHNFVQTILLVFVTNVSTHTNPTAFSLFTFWLPLRKFFRSIVLTLRDILLPCSWAIRNSRQHNWLVITTMFLIFFMKTKMNFFLTEFVTLTNYKLSKINLFLIFQTNFHTCNTIHQNFSFIFHFHFT